MKILQVNYNALYMLKCIPKMDIIIAFFLFSELQWHLQIGARVKENHALNEQKLCDKKDRSVSNSLIILYILFYKENTDLNTQMQWCLYDVFF